MLLGRLYILLNITKYSYLISLTIADILNSLLVKGAAKEASSRLSANPRSPFLNAQVSLVPSPQKAIAVPGTFLIYLT